MRKVIAVILSALLAVGPVPTTAYAEALASAQANGEESYSVLVASQEEDARNLPVVAYRTNAAENNSSEVADAAWRVWHDAPNAEAATASNELPASPLVSLELVVPHVKDAVEYRLRNGEGVWSKEWTQSGVVATACSAVADKTGNEAASANQGVPDESMAVATGVQAELDESLRDKYDLWYCGQFEDGTWLAWVQANDQLATSNKEPLFNVAFVILPKGEEPAANGMARTSPSSHADEPLTDDVPTGTEAQPREEGADERDNQVAHANGAEDEVQDGEQMESVPTQTDDLTAEATNGSEVLDEPQASGRTSSKSRILSIQSVRTDQDDEGGARSAKDADKSVSAASASDAAQSRASARNAQPATSSLPTGSVVATPRSSVAATASQAQESLASTLALTASSEVAPVFDGTVAWSRFAGNTRYDTMASIAVASFSQSKWAIVATGENFPDALAASALAGVRSCPIIITKSNELSAQAREQLQRLGTEGVFIVGGPAVVSTEVETALVGMGLEVERVAGDDRMQTSLEVYEAVREAGSISDCVVVASGSNFPDALSIGPWTYASKTPIVLTNANGLLTGDEVVAILEDPLVKRIIVVGGASVVGNVEAQLGSGYVYERLAGANRYETSKRIAQWEVTHGFTWSTPYVTTGKNFPDALTGSVLCGSTKSVMLLADAVDSPTLDLLSAQKRLIGRGYILGGPAAFPFDDPITAYETRDVGKMGYQNPEGFYQVSSKNVTITSEAVAPWNYVTPSRIGMWATREDCVNVFIQRAKEYLGTPYMWDYSCAPGVGVDCIGLVYQCAYACGMDLGGGTGYYDFNPWAHYVTGPAGWHSHDANNFWDYGAAMHIGLSQRQPGDLISWAGHIAIYVGNDTIIEAYPGTGVAYASMWAHGSPRGCIRLFH